MDPKSASALDPKLKEVYDRVMGTATGSNKTQPVVTPAPAATSMPPQVIGLNNTTPPLAESPTQVQPMPNTPPLGGNSEGQGISASSLAAGTPASSTTTSTMPSLGGSSLGQNASPLPGQANNSPQTQTSPLKPTVDYASLAAKYATPMPTLNSVSNPSPRPTVVTPSTTTYGVINNGGTKPAEKKDKKENSGGGMKKILLIVGLPIALFAYTAIWIVVFKVDVMALLPL